MNSKKKIEEKMSRVKGKINNKKDRMRNIQFEVSHLQIKIQNRGSSSSPDRTL